MGGGRVARSLAATRLAGRAFPKDRIDSRPPGDAEATEVLVHWHSSVQVTHLRLILTQNAGAYRFHSIDATLGRQSVRVQAL
jgi:hypothetical protein